MNKQKQSIKLIEVTLLCVCVLSFAFSLISFASAAQQVRTGCVRLHILANSDSDADQSMKLAVRDALLASGSVIFSGEVNTDNARAMLEESTPELKKTALGVIAEHGCDYTVDIQYCEEYFTTRSYGDMTLPAGEYTAIKVIIGEGAGKNWWCVMFPPLCLPGFCEKEASSYLTEDGAALIQEKPQLEPRFRIVEIYEYIADKLAR